MIQQQENIEDPKIRIRQIIASIEESYRKGLEEGVQRIRERDEREQEIEVIQENIQRLKIQREELQQLSREQTNRNSFLSEQIEDSEKEAMQNSQSIQEMKILSQQLEEAKLNLESTNTMNYKQQQTAEELENFNEECVMKLEQNKNKINKLQTEIELSRERLEQLLKKYGELKRNDKTIHSFQQKLENDINKYSKLKEKLLTEHSSLFNSITQLQKHLTQIQQSTRGILSNPTIKDTKQENSNPLPCEKQLRYTLSSAAAQGHHRQSNLGQDFITNNISKQQIQSKVPFQNLLAMTTSIFGSLYSPIKKKYAAQKDKYCRTEISNDKENVKNQNRKQLSSSKNQNKIMNKAYERSFSANNQRTPTKHIKQQLFLENQINNPHKQANDNPHSSLISNLLVGSGFVAATGILLYGTLKN